MKEKLPNKLVTDGIKQTSNKLVEASPNGSDSPRSKIQPIEFRDSSILGIKKTNTKFWPRRFI